VVCLFLCIDSEDSTDNTLDVPSQGQADGDTKGNGKTPHPGSVCLDCANTFQDSSAAKSSTESPSGGNAPRGGPRKPLRKAAAQPTQLESVDDSLDPLGPLGSEPPTVNLPTAAEQAPTPPKKEIASRPRPPSNQSNAEFGEADSTTLPVGRTRGAPPVQPQTPNIPRQFQPSISIEQAAKPTFEITVGDPHKVGDLTSSHIVYQVHTKVFTTDPIL
jgi:sorting nexin-1/2